MTSYKKEGQGLATFIHYVIVIVHTPQGSSYRKSCQILPKGKKITDRGLKYAHLRVQISTFEGANMHIGAPLKLALGVPPPPPLLRAWSYQTLWIVKGVFYKVMGTLWLFWGCHFFPKQNSKLMAVCWGIGWLAQSYYSKCLKSGHFCLNFRHLDFRFTIYSGHPSQILCVIDFRTLFKLLVEVFPCVKSLRIKLCYLKNI